MKTKFLLTFLVLFSMFSLSYASFPVHRTANVNVENVSLQEDSDSVTMESPAAGAANKEMIVAVKVDVTEPYGPIYRVRQQNCHPPFF